METCCSAAHCKAPNYNTEPNHHLYATATTITTTTITRTFPSPISSPNPNPLPSDPRMDAVASAEA